MKIIITLMLLCSIALAQWGPGGIPTDWRGYGLEWMESEKFTSPLATPNFMHMDGDTLTWELSGTSADRDIFLNLQEEDGTKHLIYWDDGTSGVRTTETIRAGGFFGISFRDPNLHFALGQGAAGIVDFYSSSTRPTILINPNNTGAVAAGAVEIGVVGDNDTLNVNCVESNFNGALNADTLQVDAMLGLVTEISAATYTATLSDYQILLTDTCAVTLPAMSVAYDSTTATTGYGAILMVKAENISDCTVDGSGTETIDGSDAAITLSPWDNLVIMATHDGWIIQ